MPEQLLDSVRNKFGAVAESTHEDLSSLLDTYDVNQAAASVRVYAVKPGARS